MAQRTNEKLYFAQLLVAQALQTDGALQRALIEAVVFELLQAYRGFLGEVTAALNEKVQLIDDARQLLRQLQQGGRDSSIIRELADLERRGDWPAQLLRAYSTISEATPNRESPAPQSIDPLQLVTLNDDAVDIGVCQRWLNALQDFVDNQRAFLQEW
jgi:hypothetical protein